MPGDTPAKNTPVVSRRLFNHLQISSLQEDLLFFFAAVLAVSVLFHLGIFVTGPGHDPVGSHLLLGMVFGAFGIVQSLVTWTVILLGVSLIEHFFLLFVDAHQGFERTMKSVIYALLPIVLFWWAVAVMKVPAAGPLLLLCFALITYFGICVFHDISKDRAAFASLATSAAVLVLFSRWIVGPAFGL
ncbi:hypothetical protein J2129_002063 [Methanofollis sp. W23]|uniref:YIP1 family protein n=1 Tax=Methanofollis sp. W23 TaxID=2817849 RepID=UPI001AE33F55|nr:YIP1 family protein [Methanofollis sp. W23]MBP2146609.1 hypothetical protein [Methanofollis sp. W23]